MFAVFPIRQNVLAYVATSCVRAGELFHNCEDLIRSIPLHVMAKNGQAEQK
jgi:hypothetical protein